MHATSLNARCSLLVDDWLLSPYVALFCLNVADRCLSCDVMNVLLQCILQKDLDM